MFHIPQLHPQVLALQPFIEEPIVKQCQQIREWFTKQWQQTPPPVYGSVDLRNAGFKVAPVDMNLFPAGFNNLNPDFLAQAVAACQKTIARILPQAKKILVIPESHTRNLLYWENIFSLKKILTAAGYVVRLGFLEESLTEARDIPLSSGEVLTIEPLTKANAYLKVADFIPDIILLNNDLSAGIPEKLQGIKQVFVPPVELGWHQRLKSAHFQFYAQVVQEFSELIQIDPWLIDPLFAHCGEIDFMQQAGLECLITHAQILFKKIQDKYAQYNISQQPFLMIKADAGTYGMAVMTVRKLEELTALNRKQRTRMSMTKGGQQVRKVIVQEGVYTFETMNNGAVAEPVVYLWGEAVIGGFYRVHKERGIDENLNAPGMHFEPMAFAKPCSEPHLPTHYQPGAHRHYLYGVIAQLSMLAAAREIKRL